MFERIFQLRLWRLQFGLRALLLLMAVVAVELTVYRWPWEEEGKLGPGQSVKTRFHRGWNGRPVKHGWEVVNFTGTITRADRLYDEGELRFGRNWSGNEVVGEAHYRGDQPHGPYWILRDGARTAGAHQHGLEHGVWEITRPDVIQRQEYKAGQLHGRRTWTTPNGRLLQSAEYEHGTLVHWNDQPLEVALRRWLDANVPDAERRERLWARVESPSTLRLDYCDYEQVLYSFANQPRSWKLAIQHPREGYARQREAYHDAHGQRLIEWLLAEALANSRTLAFRFNTPHVVPITAASLDWRDRTGVYDVQFEPNSPQAQAWLREAKACEFLEYYPAARFEDMLTEIKGGIRVDTAAFSEPELPALLGGPRGPNPYRARRDLLGQHLDRENCACVQDGNTLIIKRLE